MLLNRASCPRSASACTPEAPSYPATRSTCVTGASLPSMQQPVHLADAPVCPTEYVVASQVLLHMRAAAGL